MSLDLYAREVSQELSRLDGTKTLEPSAFDGFVRGTGIYAMKSFAATARMIDMAGAPIAMAQDAFTGGTEAQDRYFKEHDEVLNSAVDYWTPRPLEVGVAAEIAGGLLGQLPVIIANPHLAVASQVLSTAEDLARQNVPAGKAVAAGVVQGAGLATGIWMPILGQNAFQRMVIGGAGFNMLQGGLTRGVTGMILEGTPAAEEFKAFDGKALTLDALLGFAFGGVAHLSPAQRAHGTEAMERIKTWAQDMKPSDVAALATLRTAQHLNEDSAPGKPAEPKDVEAHVERMRTAIDQLAKDNPVEVSDLPAPDTNPDPSRFTAAERRFERLQAEGEKVAKANGLIQEEPAAREQPAVSSTTEEAKPTATVTLYRGSKDGQPGNFYSPDRDVAWMYAGEQGTVTEESVTFDNLLKAKTWQEAKKTLGLQKSATMPELITEAGAQGYDGITFKTTNGTEYVRTEPKKTEAPAGQPRGAEPPPPRGPSGEKPAGAEATKAPDPLAVEAERIATERPDMRMVVGLDAEGKPITKSAKEFLDDARGAAKAVEADQDLLRAAASCLLGIA